MNPIVSVIIPAFNMERHIKETIDSVLSQTYTNFEIIVVDDGSTDNTAAIVKSIKDGRLKYFYQPNSGLPAKPRNKGVELSRGEYIAFLDHDDLWMKDKLEKQMAIMQQDSNLALISTNALVMIDTRMTNKQVFKCLKTGYFIDKEFMPDLNIIQSTVIIKKSVFLAVGGYNEDADLKAIEDYDLWLRIYPRYSCFYLSDCLIIYRIIETSSQGHGNELQYVNRELKHYNKYFASYGFSEYYNKTKLSKILHHLAAVQYLSGDNDYLNNSKKAYQLNRSVSGLFMCLLFLFPRKLTIKIYRLRRRIMGSSSPK